MWSDEVCSRSGSPWHLTALDELRNRFPDRASKLTSDVVLDTLYAIGFLGVHRNDRVVYAHEQKMEDRVEPTDEAFSIHPSFRYALRAESPTAFMPVQWDRPLSFGPLGSPQSHQNYSLSIRRGSVPYALLRSVTTQVRRLLAGLVDAGLPTEVRDDIVDNMHHILHFTDTMTDNLDAYSESMSVVKHVMDVSAFLVGLGVKLEDDGFADKDKARIFIRSMAEVGARLRREAAGTEPG